MTVAGELLELSPTERPDLFHAVVGGFGELAIILEVELRLKKVYSGLLEVAALSADGLDPLFDRMQEHLDRADYVVGWIDGFASGRHLGRGLVHAATQLTRDQDPDSARTLDPENQALPSRFFGVVPRAWMWALMKPFAHRTGMRLVNAIKYWTARWFSHGRRYRQGHAAFHFLLDYVPNWKRVYAPGGLIQHQSFVPDGAARATFSAILALTHQHRLPSWLAVIKRHRPDGFLMSHGLDGWSLALDFPVTAGNRARLWRMCREIDALVVAAQGRFYFAKDATLDPASVRQAWGESRLRQFGTFRNQYDPDGLLATDLYDRAVGPILAELAADPSAS